MKARLLSVTAVLLLSTMSWASAPKGLSSSESQAAFARLKSLAGEWEGADANGGKSHLRYEVISGGSAVAEHFQSDDMGAANAMLTVYYLDGGQLVLTHYCMAQNQPHMQAQSFDSAIGDLQFAFVGASGLPGPEAGHMHNASFRFIDADHFSTDWQFFEGGKLKFNETVQYRRVR
jgi:hypothetical protein